MSEMKSMTLNGKRYDCFVDSVARSQVEATAVVGSAYGENIAVTDASNYVLAGLRIFGKTIQEGTPTLDVPVDLVSAGDNGGVTVSVTSGTQSHSVTVATPNGLPGVPVTSGGNYTDANGQQWICDEIDFARGVYVKRVGTVMFTGVEKWYYQEKSKYFYTLIADRKSGSELLCDRLPKSKDLTNSTTIGWWAMATDNSLFAVTGLPNAGIASTVDEIKTYVTANPIEVVYILSTMSETPLSEEELAAYASLHTYRNSTIVSNDASAHMEMEYVMDAKKYIDRQISAGILAATVE